MVRKSKSKGTRSVPPPSPPPEDPPINGAGPATTPTTPTETETGGTSTRETVAASATTNRFSSLGGSRRQHSWGGSEDDEHEQLNEDRHDDGDTESSSPSSSEETTRGTDFAEELRRYIARELHQAELDRREPSKHVFRLMEMESLGSSRFDQDLSGMDHTGRDRAALAALFRATAGGYWHKNNNWNKIAHVGTWYGVTEDCHGHGHVTMLGLRHNNLQGILPDTLGNLAALMELSLRGNSLKGYIPASLGKLDQLQTLDLFNNRLRGKIPKELGNLTALKELNLGGNHLKGEIPASVGKLVMIEVLDLHDNELNGEIPGSVGQLGHLRILNMSDNDLSGEIPASLGRLGQLRTLSLHRNRLSGEVPESLGRLGRLQTLNLDNNHLSGEIPSSLGRLGQLRTLSLHRNQLSDEVPASLRHLRELQTLTLGDSSLRGMVPVYVDGAGVSIVDVEGVRAGPDEPVKNETLGSWRARLQQKAERDEESGTVAADVSSEKGGVPAEDVTLTISDGGDEVFPGAQRAPSSQASEAAETPASLAEGTSSSQQMETSIQFREQVASFVNLEDLTKTRETLEEVKLLIGASSGSWFTPGSKLSDVDKLTELDKLVKMANTLCAVASSYREDEDLQRQELALPTDLKEYHTTLRTGVCNAYLAASVISSNLVRTSKIGRMGAAGKAMHLLCDAVPLVGGLAGLASAALIAGDSYIQTQRIIKITSVAPDAVECCSLARRLALRLADCVAEGHRSAIPTRDEVRMHNMGSIGRVAVQGPYAKGWLCGVMGESYSVFSPKPLGSATSQGADPVRGCASEGEVMEWFLDKITSFEPDDAAGEAARARQDMRKLAKRHLRVLLKAVGRGCLHDTRSAEEKVSRLVPVIFPKAKRRPTSSPNASARSVLAVSYSGMPRCSPGIMAEEMAAMRDNMAAFSAMQAQMEALQHENKTLIKKVEMMEKKMSKPRGEPADHMYGGHEGEQVLSQARKVATKESFWRDAESSDIPAQERALTTDEHQARTRDLEAFVDELDDRIENIEALQEKGDTRGGGLLKRLRRLCRGR